MSQPIDNGGNAFPCLYNNGLYGGMSLRDWFAGQVLTGLLAHEGARYSPQTLAAMAYRQADAMLDERHQPRGERA